MKSFSFQFEFFNFQCLQKTVKRDPEMALTFEGGSAARLENGRSLRNFEEGTEVVVALMLLAIVTINCTRPLITI